MSNRERLRTHEDILYEIEMMLHKLSDDEIYSIHDFIVNNLEEDGNLFRFFNITGNQEAR
jgi:hypothetical protein